MSARHITSSAALDSVASRDHTIRLDLTAGDVRIRKNGIEFRTANPIPEWTEMTVVLETPLDPHPVNFAGVVVACKGNRHAGFVVALLFTELSRQAQARLSSLALSL